MEFCHGLLGEPEQRHGEADSTNGCKDKWKNVDAWESHRQWNRMKERVQHVDRSLTMGNMVGFISSHASNQQIAYSYSPRNNTGCDAILCHIMLDWCRLWMSQPHWGRNKPKGHFCLVRNKRLRSVLSVRWSQTKCSILNPRISQRKRWVAYWLGAAGQACGELERKQATAPETFYRSSGNREFTSITVGSHAQALPLDINICMTCADMRDPIISHSNSS